MSGEVAGTKINFLKINNPFADSLIHETSCFFQGSARLNTSRSLRRPSRASKPQDEPRGRAGLTPTACRFHL